MKLIMNNNFHATRPANRWLQVIAVSVLTTVPAWGGQIPGLFNTGVNGAGAPLADDASDPHYKLAMGSAVAGPAIVITSAGQYLVAPFGPWLSDDTASAWIAPSASALGPNEPSGRANYWYETKFDLTGLNPATAVITGHWATDNGGMDILINGLSTGQANTQQFTDFTYFQINSGFVAGTNTLTFVLNNGAGDSASGGPTGLRVEMTGTADPMETEGPHLSIKPFDDGHFILSWPGVTPNFSLREIVDLPPPPPMGTNPVPVEYAPGRNEYNNRWWTPVTNEVVPLGDRMTVMVNATEEKRFFRLQPVLQQRATFPKPGQTIVDLNKVDARQIVLKFQEGTHIRMRAGALAFDPGSVSPDERALLARVDLTPSRINVDLKQIRELLQEDPQRQVRRMFEDVGEEVLARNKAEGEARSGEELADMDLYYRLIVPQFDADMAAGLINALNRFQSVEIAYAEPFSSGAACADLSPTTTIDVTPSQGYLMAAPGGIDAKYAWSYPGGSGAGVRIIDVEGGWHLDHEDLSGSHFFQDGIFSIAAGDIEHGTAVLGELVACNNSYGATGIVPDTAYGVSSVIRPFSLAWGWPPAMNSTALPVLIASLALRAGDVILIEQHAPGPSSGLMCSCNCSQFEFVAMENWQADFDAIRMATALGIVVVEAAGNGSMNLDGPQYVGRFNRAIRDSGAILVGAGMAAGGSGRSPECWSNFGSRVDVQGWGDSVGTLGDGTDPSLRANGTDSRQWYRRNFSGTSSASPIVAGAACAVQGVRRARGMPVLSPFALRSLLRSTGTPQPLNTVSRQIGPLPDLHNALNSFLPQTAAFISQSVPNPMVAGQTYTVTVTMRNTGQTTWKKSTLHRLGSQNPQDNSTWGGRIELPSDVGPGNMASFNFQVTAPAPGHHNFQWRMVQDSVEWFGDFTPNISVQVVPANNAACFVSQNGPTMTGAGDQSLVTVTMRNCGNTTWTSGAHYRLGSQSPPDNNLWGLNRVELPNAVAPGASVTFSFVVTAPPTPFPRHAGSVFYQWQMVQDGGVGFFGEATPLFLVLLWQ